MSDFAEHRAAALEAARAALGTTLPWVEQAVGEFLAAVRTPEAVHSYSLPHDPDKGCSSCVLDYNSVLAVLAGDDE